MQPKEFFRSNRGSTLYEVLIATVIAGVIAVSVIALLYGGLDGWSRGTSKAYAETSSNLASQKLAQEIRDAQSAVTSDFNRRLTVTFPQEIEGADGEKSYRWGVAGQVRTYYRDANSSTLKRNINGVESVVLRRVSNVDFRATGTGGQNVKISITGQEQVGKFSADDISVARVRLRNVKT